MDDTQTLISEIKSRFNFTQSKLYLKEKYKNKLLVAHKGGMWNITPEFISMLNNYPDDNIILLDIYENPVSIDKLELLSLASHTYNTVMSQWLQEFNELKKNR